MTKVKKEKEYMTSYEKDQLKAKIWLRINWGLLILALLLGIVAVWVWNESESAKLGITAAIVLFGTGWSAAILADRRY